MKYVTAREGGQKLLHLRGSMPLLETPAGRRRTRYVTAELGRDRAARVKVVEVPRG